MPTPPMSLETALAKMRAAADEAESRGETAKADGIRRDLAVTKLQVAEREREAHPRPSRMGPGSVELFKNTGSLTEDTALGGI